VEPGELSRRVEIRAAAVQASDRRIAIKKPVQSWVQASVIEDSRGTKEGQMPRRELGERTRDEERIGECCVAQRSRREPAGLDDSGSH
jgi:hypothetical protein